ncbi:unnamed protein product [Rhizoctonia solani]|uniref:Peptidase C14 caspase domain-containing protein n=1 Tax=Rhizoctonia solani TaxID=456999 RepID=A0A8H3CPP4_9AGAM|nr:unnamed protein product [Rhizoctonia solani]
MVAFLTSDLKVPKHHIVELYNQSASRKAIIDAFITLQNNIDIHKDDPILIFFAGHGGLINAPPEWVQKHGTSKIQVIFPYDYGFPIANTGDVVNCIPDTTISRLLNQLAEAKGNNITVVSDSCHSASGTRDDLARPGLKARSAEPKFAMPYNIDQDILTHPSLGSKIGRGTELLLRSDQASHIHIAACGSAEKAWEDDGKGWFTTALLDTLRQSRVDNITYENLIKALPTLPSQSPHCYGQNKSRVLFNSRPDLQTKVFIPVACVFNAGHYELFLQAGDESGVTENSLWELHESATEDSPPRARAIAGLPDVLTTELALDKQYYSWLYQRANETPESTKTWMYARHLHAGHGTELNVWCSSLDLQSLLTSPAPNAIDDPAHEFGYVLHKEQNQADIELWAHSSVSHGARPAANLRVVFRLRDPVAEEYDIAELNLTKPAIREEIETVLFAAARWKWHLQRTNLYPIHRSPQIETMRMVKVATKTRTGRDYLITPVVVAERSKGLVELVAEANALYGVELASRANSPLYIKMFYFDATDFSVGDMFGHSVAKGSEDATIPPGGKIMIGDGQDGGSPLRFTLSPGNKVELGYLKVFWCTSPLELSDLAQKSAFGMRPGTRQRAVGRTVSKKPDWGTACLTLVLKAT